MRTTLLFVISCMLCPAETSLTIYNQDLAVVRATVPLSLVQGISTATFDQATAQVLPDSVVLRDPRGEHEFSILEQSYRNDPVTKSLLLEHFEGQSIDFRKQLPDGKIETLSGKIIRSGYDPGGRGRDPIIEINKKLWFTLPGEPLFPALGDDSILRPTIQWQLESPAAVSFEAQLSYLTRGLSWAADYNFVALEDSDTLRLNAWITAVNHSGTGFKNAKVKLVAGDVNVVEPPNRSEDPFASSMMRSEGTDAVTQKAFDDFHLYSLPRSLTLRDQETKQVEFLRADKIKASKSYVYDPMVGYRWRGSTQLAPAQTTDFSKDIGIYWKLENTEANGLGVPLPAGSVRFYREDSTDGNLEFVGENTISHTPQNEELEIYTGNAFDLIGERTVQNFEVNERESRAKETIEVTIKNRSKELKVVTVLEHRWRSSNWMIEESNQDFEKIDADTIRFIIKLQPDEVKTLTFVSHYRW